MQSSNLGDQEEDTVVEVESSDVTRPHDGGEWLRGFATGVNAGKKDALGALGRVLGPGSFADDLMLKVIAEMEPKVKPNG